MNSIYIICGSVSMKKGITLILALVLLTACGQPTVEVENETPETEETTIVTITTTVTTAIETETTTTATTVVTTPIYELTGSSSIISDILTDKDKSELSEAALWKVLYIEILIKHIDDRSCYFNICDLDEDGIPELLLSENQYHVIGGHIYTVYQRELTDLGYFGSYGEFEYDAETKYIYAHWAGGGVGIIQYVYKLENGEMIELISFQYNEHIAGEPEEYVYYAINNTEVSYDVYEEERSKYTFGWAYGSDGRFAGKYKVTQSEIERVIGEY